MPVTVTVVEVVSANRVILACALCEGSGRRPGYSADTACRVCGGRGVVLIEGQQPFVECQLCSGSGRRPGYSSDTACRECHGVGAQPIAGGLEIIR